MFKLVRKFYITLTLVSVLFTVAFLVLLPQEADAGKRKLIRVDGSSTVFPITEAVAEEFQMANRGIMVMVGVSGTGGGFKKFSRNETDINDASRTIKAKEVAMCRETVYNRRNAGEIGDIYLHQFCKPTLLCVFLKIYSGSKADRK